MTEHVTTSDGIDKVDNDYVIVSRDQARDTCGEMLRWHDYVIGHVLDHVTHVAGCQVDMIM
jgi:hypothetical protein